MTARHSFVLIALAGLALVGCPGSSSSKSGKLASNMMLEPSSGGDSGSCNANPTCALETASDVNMALAKNIVGPTARHNVTKGQILNLCHYDTDPATTDKVDPVDIAYGFPVTMADFKAGRATIMGPTTTLPNLGDAAFWSEPRGMTYGVHSVVVLVGCVQLQVVGSTSVAQLVALAKKIISKL